MRLRPLAAALGIALSFAPWAVARTQAQPVREQFPAGAVVGIVSASDSTPLPDAQVRLTRDGRALMARSDDDGSFAFANLAPGTYLLSVRRIGYTSYAQNVVVLDRQSTMRVLLASTREALDTFRVRANFTGVTGVVGAFTTMEALAGASVHLLGARDTLRTGADGRFAFPLPSAGGSVALRVTVPGYEPRLMSVTVPRNQRVEVAVLLDSAPDRVSDTYVFADLDKRMRAANARAGIIGRAELIDVDAPDLLTALQLSTSSNLRGLTASRRSCLFVNGIARPGLPVDAVRIDEVEFIELYPAEADFSRTIATHWPPKADCGIADYRAGGVSALDIQGSDFRKRDDNAHFAKYVLVWTRK